MDLKQTQTISQKLIMTTEMKQSLAVLQMGAVELTETIIKELDENPVLEEDYAGTEQLLDSLVAMSRDVNYDKNNAAYEEERESPINYAVKKETLKDFLYEQAGYLHESSRNQEIISYLIESVDRRGYLGCSLEEVEEEFKASEEEVLYCLRLAQDFQPEGVMARDLSECLMIQLRKKGVTNPCILKIAEEYLTLLSENKMKKIGQILNVSPETAAEYCNLIRSLEPKPSRGFSEGENDAYIIPEAYIQRQGDEINVVMNYDSVPRLKISQYYKDIYHTGMDQETKLYMKDRLNSALTLMKNIDQRHGTVFNILHLLVKHQEEYFKKGPRYLKPMTIRQIASELECHESTVSRAIKEKYVQTAFGLIRIKDLFSSGYSLNQQDCSSRTIKTEIESLIQNENKKNPYSDQQLAELLAEKLMPVSRRTVAKYREEMNIPSSTKRKMF